jgi:hypothetical protein
MVCPNSIDLTHLPVGQGIRSGDILGLEEGALLEEINPAGYIVSETRAASDCVKLTQAIGACQKCGTIPGPSNPLPPSLRL